MKNGCARPTGKWLFVYHSAVPNAFLREFGLVVRAVMNSLISMFRNANRRQEAVRYGQAIFAAVAALILRKLLNPLLGADNAYHTAWAAVVFSVWFCGLRPAIVTTAVTFIGIWYWFLPPHGSFAIHSYSVLFGMMSFLFFSGVIVALGES